MGFVYECRPNMDYSMYTDDRWANKYKLKIGVSLLDLGTIKFNKLNNQAGSYNTNIPAGDNFNLGVFDGKSINQFVPLLNSSPYFVPLSQQNSSYNVNLPTILQGEIDDLFAGNWDVNLAGQFNTNKKINYNLYYYNSYSVTPRWENSLVSVELPLNYNELTQFNAGLAVRIGPFFIGSGSVISALFHDTRQADLHVGLNWGMQWKKKLRPDTDKDGVYDDVDKCPTVYGLQRYQGCPIPDTDGDGINDEIDSCVTVPAIKPESGEIIARAAKIMNEQIPNSSFYVDGFTDNVGSAARNKALSKARAQAFVNQLIKDGVAKDRLLARGFGKEYPKCLNNTEEGRQCNRRVEVSIRNVNQKQEKTNIPVN